MNKRIRCGLLSSRFVRNFALSILPPAPQSGASERASERPRSTAGTSILLSVIQLKGEHDRKTSLVEKHRNDGALFRDVGFVVTREVNTTRARRYSIRRYRPILDARDSRLLRKRRKARERDEERNALPVLFALGIEQADSGVRACISRTLFLPLPPLLLLLSPVVGLSKCPLH